MVVSILLSILKIIGIILLCILGLLLLVILLVLFVPIRYKVTADSNINDTDKEYHVTAKVSWLLWLIRGKIAYPSKEGFVLKIGPFTVYGGKEKPKKNSKNKSSKKSARAKETINENEQENVAAQEKDDTLNIEMQADKAEDVKILEETLEAEFEKKSGKKSLKEKILYTRQKIYDKITKIQTKIKNIIKNIKKYADIIQSEEFKEAFLLCKSSLVRLFGMIKPRKVKINGTVGMKSPDQTGYICAAVGVVSPFFKNKIRVIPDFEHFIVKGDAVISGRIYLFVVLIVAIKAFFDKNIRNVIEMFRREEA